MYYPLFDGEKVIYVSSDSDIPTELKSSISDRLGGVKKFVKNDPENRESKYFIEQLSILKSSGGMIFYHHSKGSTYTNPNVDKWTSSMYYFNLNDDNIKKVENEFNIGKIFSGIFRVDYPSPPWVYSDWHFSGTFFWINSLLFEINDWNKMEIGRFSVESYPGSKVQIDKSYNIDYITNIDYGIGGSCDLRYSHFWKYFPDQIDRDVLFDFNELLIDNRKEEYKSDISVKESAWIGHFYFAIDLVRLLSPNVIVELGVDWGFSMLSFAYPKIGDVYGIDWFQGDQCAGIRNTKEYLDTLTSEIKSKYGVSVNVIQGDFTEVSNSWNKEIDILHIDGDHSYESVSRDFTNWSKFVGQNGVVLFHDVEEFESVNVFFSSLGGYKLIRNGSCGLGIWTLSKVTYDKIRMIL